MTPILSKVITMSDLIDKALTKLIEVYALEEAMELNERDLSNVIVRSQIQRRLIHLRAIELQEVLHTLQAFAESAPTVKQ